MNRGEVLKLLLLISAAFAAFLGFEVSAVAATSDGQSFPCTDSFAKQVAISSGFVDAVNAKTENHYANPDSWRAAQIKCADFDLDESDEMVFSLRSRGGSDPWAFFDVPNGREEATYAFPVIEWHRVRYPNHLLTVIPIEPGDTPGVMDTRRLFRPRDAHCCPTGGWLIRAAAFNPQEDRYRFLSHNRLGPPRRGPGRKALRITDR